MSALLESFEKVLDVLGVKTETSLIGKRMQELKGLLLRCRGVRKVVEYDENFKLILLEPGTSLDTVREKVGNVEIVHYCLKLGYSFLSFKEALSIILPEETRKVSAFETIGHIVRINIPEEHAEYDKIIGRIILDKIKGARTVVRKTGMVCGVSRTFGMKVISGSDCLKTVVSQNKCLFHLDYSQVYWNTRLDTEHTRLLTLLKPGEYVCDVFAGVGPFSIPAIKKGCIVYSNDLNPVAYEYLKMNMQKNGIRGWESRVFCMDGRSLIKHLNTLNIFFDHYIMNLPMDSASFLDAFNSLNLNEKIPIIHCYLFAYGEEKPEDIIGKRIDILDLLKVQLVRFTSRKTRMYCVSFRPLFIKTKAS